MHAMNLIKSIRRKVGITQSAFATLAGVNQSTVSRWERGEADPTITQVSRVIEGLNGAVTPCDFYPIKEASHDPS